MENKKMQIKSSISAKLNYLLFGFSASCMKSQSRSRMLSVVSVVCNPLHTRSLLNQQQLQSRMIIVAAVTIDRCLHLYSVDCLQRMMQTLSCGQSPLQLATLPICTLFSSIKRLMKDRLSYPYRHLYHKESRLQVLDTTKQLNYRKTAFPTNFLPILATSKNIVAQTMPFARNSLTASATRNRRNTITHAPQHTQNMLCWNYSFS